jgi:hypothetical protein
MSQKKADKTVIEKITPKKSLIFVFETEDNVELTGF